MKRFYMKSAQTMRKITALMAMIFVAVAANAGTGSTFYYKATANMSPTGSGKVYVATQATTNPAYQSSAQTITGSQYSVGSADVTFHYYAQANTGWIFDHWAKGNANGTSVSTDPHYQVTEEVTSTRSGNPTSFTYYAVFKQQTGQVKVYSSNTNRGSVYIDNPNNTLGQNVEISATPDVANGVYFLGWKRENSESAEFVSTQNPYSFNVTEETKGDYYAFFSDPQEKVYCRIRNRNTGRFISLYGNAKAEAHQGVYDGNSFDDGYVFTNGLKMISPSDAQGNPSTVFLRTGTPMGVGFTALANLSALGVSFQNNLVDTQHQLQMQANPDGSFKIYTIVSVPDDDETIYLSSYLCDEGTDWAVMKTGESSATSTASNWDIYILDENLSVGAFGANTKAKFTQDGKYYTTMYTDFDYKMLDGVKAYYLPAEVTTSYDEENQIVHLVEVTGDKVPAHTAVVLECKDVQNTAGDNPVLNRLLPLVYDADNPVAPIVGESLNLLKGYVSVNGSTKANNKKLMYVLSFNNGLLGFYHSNSQNMTPFKAYIELPDVVDESMVKDIRFAFGDPEEDATAIISLRQLMGEEDAPVYDLRGIRVADSADDMNNLPKGIYISGGKKYILK